MVDTTVFETALGSAVQDVLKTGIALFFNGIYVLLFAFALYFLRCRGPPGYSILICAIAVMFIFAMTEIALQIVTATLSIRALSDAAGHAGGTIHTVGAGQLDSLQRISRILSFVEDLLLATNNTVTDSFLIYRCHLIWRTSRHNKKIVLLPVLLLLSTTVAAYVTVHRNHLAPLQAHFDSRISFGLVMSTNLVVTGLTVGRIWCTRRHLRTIGGQTKSIQRYNTAMAMLLESSVVYLISISLLLVALSFKDSSGACPVAYVFFYGFGGQLMNIIPALIIVRVSLASTKIEPDVAQRKLASV